jgi:hypothetical protein
MRWPTALRLIARRLPSALGGVGLEGMRLVKENLPKAVKKALTLMRAATC